MTMVEKNEHPYAEWRAASERDRLILQRQQETLAELQGRRERANAKYEERLTRAAYLAIDGGLPELLAWEEALDRLLALDPDWLG